MVAGLFRARVFVTLKPMVNDPQGLTVLGGLKNLGFSSVRDLRVGKLIEIVVEAPSEDQARREVDEMCDKLLANPVIERYRFDIEAAEPRDGAGADTDR